MLVTWFGHTVDDILKASLHDDFNPATMVGSLIKTPNPNRTDDFRTILATVPLSTGHFAPISAWNLLECSLKWCWQLLINWCFSASPNRWSNILRFLYPHPQLRYSRPITMGFFFMLGFDLNFNFDSGSYWKFALLKAILIWYVKAAETHHSVPSTMAL